MLGISNGANESVFSLVVYDIPQDIAAKGQRVRAKLRQLGTAINKSVWLVKTAVAGEVLDWAKDTSKVDPRINLHVIAFAESDTEKVKTLAAESFKRDIQEITAGLDRTFAAVAKVLSKEEKVAGQHNDALLRRRRSVYRAHALLRSAEVALVSFQLTDSFAELVEYAKNLIKAKEQVAVRTHVKGSTFDVAKAREEVLSE